MHELINRIVELILSIDWLSDFIAVCGATKRAIVFASWVECFIIVFVMYLLHGAFREQRWAKLFARAFAALGILYFSRWLGQFQGIEANELYRGAHILIDFVASPLNNLLVLAAALALQRITPRVPIWIFVSAAVAVTAISSRTFDQEQWHRIPDALLSFGCLSLPRMGSILEHGAEAANA